MIDLPERIRVWTRRYFCQSGGCESCNKRVRSRHPEPHSEANAAAGVPLGPRLLSVADLKHRVGITYRKVCGLFELLFRVTVSAGALCRAEKGVAARCEPTVTALVEVLREAPIVGIDETGGYIAEAERKPWLWVFPRRDPPITRFAIRQSRGGDVPKEILGADFQRAIPIDGWAGYDCLDCNKGQCNAHLLRRCRELLEEKK